MPAKSKKQERFLQMCAHNPDKARGKCPSKSQARRALGYHGTARVMKKKRHRQRR